MSEAPARWFVRGTLFVDYVRMIRRRKDVDWYSRLPPEDVPYLLNAVVPDQWYPMEVFERLGNAILSATAPGNFDAVRMWGRLSAGPLADQHPGLVAPRDPVETLRRFKVLRGTFFDFEALDMPLCVEGQAHLVISYYMGKMAEEAASNQTMGFCEALLQLADATEVQAEFAERSWAGDPRTLLVLRWKSPGH